MLIKCRRCDARAVNEFEAMGRLRAVDAYGRVPVLVDDDRRRRCVAALERRVAGRSAAPSVSESSAASRNSR